LDLTRRLEYDRARRLLEEYDPVTAPNPKVQARMFGLLASIYSLSPDRGSTDGMLGRALALTATIDDEALRGDTLQKANFVACQRGEYDRSEAYTTAILELCERNGFDGLAARALTTSYAVAFDRGDTVRCLWVLQRIGMHGKRAGDKSMVFFALVGTYEIEAMRGDVDRLVELERKIAGYDAKAFISATEGLLPSFALQSAWNGDFDAALQILNGSAEKLESPAGRSMRWAEIAVYAAAAADRDVVESAIRSGLAELQVFEGSSARLTYHVFYARVWLALAHLLIGRGPSANKLLQQSERDVFKAPPGAKALTSAVRAASAYLETGTEITKAIDSLRHADLAGYARLFEALFPARTQPEPSPGTALTRSELTVLRAVARGETSKEIAGDLCCSPLTVDSHVRAILRKLGCEGRQKAVLLARQRGLL
jgi:DNA-binding CsgD family transcriptional regulator